MTLLELAERCEKATGPDRELDRAIQLAIRKSVPSDKWTGRDTIPPQKPRHFTDSLDAAMTLIPEGWLLQLSDWQHPTLRERGPWQALLNPDRDSFEHTFKARCDHAATPALALCAAALRARASQEALLEKPDND